MHVYICVCVVYINVNLVFPIPVRGGRFGNNYSLIDCHTRLGEFKDPIEWVKFVALACAHLQPGLTATARTAIDVLGVGGMLPVETFAGSYVGA